MKALPAAALLAALWLSNAALAQTPGDKVDATLSSGDVIRGTLISDDGKTIVLSHPVLGQLTLARDNVTTMALVPVQAAPPPPPPAAPAAPEINPDPQSLMEGWKGSLELGLNGSEGNSQSVSVRGAVNLKRETSKTDTTLGLLYVYGSQDGEKNLDRGEINLRNDWKIGSPWRIFAIGKAEYDTFQDWDWRTSIFGGVGYEFIKTDRTLLLGRLGVGITKEFGSSKQRIEPELNLGLDWEHKIDDRQKVYATLDYYPSLHNFSDYRASAKAGYEVQVDPVNNLSLKLGLEDRYNSNPGPDKKKNDLLYFAAVVYNF